MGILYPQHAMRKKIHIDLLWMVVLGAFCAVAPCAHAEDYTYQSLTNLGPCASSRVLLMNNDTNEKCPIQGQGYYDTNETTTAIGGTFWVHEGAARPTGTPNNQMQLLDGDRHVLYQKTEGVITNVVS